MKKHLVAYGDQKYSKQRENFRKTALASGFFDEIHLFSELDIDLEFYEKVYAPVKTNRGGGYWIWKPYVVKKVMDQINDGDILIYCDAGFTINKDGRERFDEYIDLVSGSETGSLDFRLFWKEYQYTKQEVFQYFRVPEEIITSNQLHSSVLLLKKCEHTVMLVNEWYDIALNHSFLFTDERILPQFQQFIDHRHDQSIFSILRKIHGATIINDEICYDGYQYEKYFPFWSTRLTG